MDAKARVLARRLVPNEGEVAILFTSSDIVVVGTESDTANALLK